mgnify:CR=1 FL=1
MVLFPVFFRGYIPLISAAFYLASFFVLFVELPFSPLFSLALTSVSIFAMAYVLARVDKSAGVMGYLAAGVGITMALLFLLSPPLFFKYLDLLRIFANVMISGAWLVVAIKILQSDVLQARAGVT